MGHGIVEALGNRGTLERQATHPALPEEFLDHARCVELAQSKSEGLLVCAPQRGSGSMRPPYWPLSERLKEKACQTLLLRALDQQVGPRLVGTGRQLICKQPAA
jgi:hypothetical protein